VAATHPRLADHPAPGQRDDRRHDPPLQRRRRREWMLPTGAAAALTAGSAGTCPAQRPASPCSWVSCYCMLTRELAAEQDLSPAAPSKRCAACPRTRSVAASGPCWPGCGPCPRDACGAREQLHPQRPGPLGRTGGHSKTLASGEPAGTAAPPAARGPATGPPAISMPVSGSALHPLPAAWGSGDKTGRRNRLESAPLISEKNPR